MACEGRCNCCKGACCWDDNGSYVCSQETCEQCEDVLEGYWQGPNVPCEDVDCDTNCCCVPRADGCGSHQWRLNAAACARMGGTVVNCSAAPNVPRSGNPACDGGTPTSVTLTIAGVVSNNTAYDDMADAINASHVIDFPAANCFQSGSLQLPGLLGEQRVTVYASVNGAYGGSVMALDRILNPLQVLFLHVAGAEENLTFIDFTACGGTLYDCSTATGSLGAITNNITGASPLDFSGATFDFA